MAQVGGVRIPFVVDLTDIPRGVKEVEAELRRLKQTAATVDIRIDGKHIRKLNAESIMPLIRNLGSMRELSLRASVALQEIGKATKTLRAGKNLTDKFVVSLTKLYGIGPKTVAALRSLQKVTAELSRLKSQAAGATNRMKILTSAMSNLTKRKTIGAGQRDQLFQFASKESMAQINRYRDAVVAISAVEDKSSQEYIAAQKLARRERAETIRLLKEEYSNQKRVKNLAKSPETLALEKRVNREREKTIALLKKAGVLNQSRINALKQRFILETSPRVGYAKRLELKYARDLDRTYRELMVKRKKGIITDHERVRLARTMDKLMKRQGWESKNRLRIQKQLTLETQKQVAVEKKRSRFPGGGMFAPGRMLWFVQLRAFWAVYQSIQKVVMELIELDEAVGRSMRTMKSETLSYGEVAEKVHNTVIRVARETGAAYKDIGESLYQLSSAGLSAEEALSAVNSVMLLTRTTEAEVTDATKVISGVFNNFKDALGDVTSDTEAFAKISATLSYVWERNQVDMNEMVQALNQAAQLAKLANMQFKDLAVVIGNLGTMMIRSGRAGRSLRMAIIQLAAKGQLVADVFRYTFDPNAPLDFMKIMDKMHKEWIKMNKTTLITLKITSIFGRRAAPAILALLDNWVKVREEIEMAGDTLELVTVQQQKLLRLQMRYKQVTETLWKEMMAIVAEYVDIVAWFGRQVGGLLNFARLSRIMREMSKGARGVLDTYKDAGAVLERIGFVEAMRREAAERGDTEQVNRLQAYKEMLEKVHVILKKGEVLDQRRAQRIAAQKLVAFGIPSEIEALAAFNHELDKHRSLRGEQVYTTKQLVEQLRAEKSVLDTHVEQWKTTWRVHKKNLDVIKPMTEELLKQSDVVKKLASNLLKLYKIEQKATKQHQKDQLAFYDARIKLQEEYSKGVMKWAGLRENREMQAIDNKIERLATERSQIKANMEENRRMAYFFAEHADAVGKLPTEMVGPYQELNREYDKMARKIKLVTKEVKLLVTQSLFVGRRGVGARFERPLDIATEEEWEMQQQPKISAEQHRRRETEQQHELALYDIRTAWKEKYRIYFSWWVSEEEMQEKARMQRQRERISKEQAILEEERMSISYRLYTNRLLQEQTFDPATQQQLAGQEVALLERYKEIIRVLEIYNEKLKILEKTKKEQANQDIRNAMATKDYAEAAKITWEVYGNAIQNYAGQAVEAWKNMFEQMGQESRRAWDVYKALAIAQTIVSGIQLAWEGAKSLAGIPYVGPALAAAWIATIAAQTAVQVKTIEGQKPQGYAEGGVTYGELVMLDRKRSRAAAYGSGGVTSGAATAIVGDNPSGVELVIPSESINRDKTSGYTRRQGGDGNITVVNLLTQEDIAAAMSTKIGGTVVINHIGRDLQSRKSTYKRVKETNRRK